MSKLSVLMEGFYIIDDAKSMEEELTHNKMVKRDLGNILGYVTPYIPLIGLVCGVTIIGKHVLNRKNHATQTTEESTETVTAKRNHVASLRSVPFLTQRVIKEKLGAIVRGNRNLTLFLRFENYIRLILGQF